MEQFPHLNFVQKIEGKPRLFGGGAGDERSLANRQNRQAHSRNLSAQVNELKLQWEEAIDRRGREDLAHLDQEIIPFFLEMNPDLIDANFDLQSFGIEIISEEDDGFIIGASLDAFQSLQDKINGFVLERHATAIVADLWSITTGDRNLWRPSHILSEELLSKWQHNQIADAAQFNIEVSIAFDKPLGKEPDPAKRGGPRRLERYRQKQIDRDNKLLERENHFDDFINRYGLRISDLVHLDDCFACEVQISGLGLKDLVSNYPFVFEVAEVDEFEFLGSDSADARENAVEILAPLEGSVEVGIIDSGIMEEHRFIRPAIHIGQSQSYVVNNASTADNVAGGGHGTRVAGAVLYPTGLSNIQSPYQLPFFIRNLRVLGDDNNLQTKFPAELIKTIVTRNEACKIFNHSINAKVPFRKKHMSMWAAAIDTMVHLQNVTFVLSAGNILKDTISSCIQGGQPYPAYLQNTDARLANPAQSCFAITVGSINHEGFEDDNWLSLGNRHEISPFSRIGLGMWGQIKPDVVEYGGGLIVAKVGQTNVREHLSISPELVRTTFDGGGAVGKDRVGTSFAAPKVSHIIAQLKTLYPDENVNLLRSLLVQGARLPDPYFSEPTMQSLQHFGYGLPSLQRVTANTENRISFYSTSTIKAEEGHIYSVKIPDELRSPGDDHEILIEVTLAFTAEVRRTRQKLKSYLSTWLDWTTSKIEESFGDFRDYVLKEIENRETDYDNEVRNRMRGFNWKIGDRTNAGIRDVSRTNNSLQKDWVIIRSHELPEEISFAVRAHKGWDRTMQSIPYALTLSIEALNANVPVYNMIRIENEVEI